MSFLPQSQQILHPVSLLNPLTNHEITLPACPHVSHHYWIRPRQNQMGENVVVCCGQSCSERPILAFCHPGQNIWHTVELGSDYEGCRHYYLRGMLFSVRRGTGVTKVTSIANGANLAYVVSPTVEVYSVESTYNEYLVEDSIGDILKVCQKYDPFLINDFDVYRLDVGDKNGSSPCWVKVSSIGNQAIFIDVDGAFVLRAGKFSGIKDNSIYLLTKKSQRRLIQSTYYSHIDMVGCIDIETGAMERLPCPLKEPRSWLLPNLHHL